MIRGYATLVALLRSELTEIERAAQTVARHWRSTSSAEDPSANHASVALHLQGLYSGIERALAQIARDLDGRVRTGGSWHEELLMQMTLDVDGVRPPVLGREAAERLEAYRRFRHRVRHVYASALDPELMTGIVGDRPEVLARLRRDLDGFCGFLDAAARADEGDSAPA